MSKLHPVIVRVRKGQRRLTNEEVMRLPHEDLVRYCDGLLTPESAIHILLGCLEPEWSRGPFSNWAIRARARKRSRVAV